MGTQLVSSATESIAPLASGVKSLHLFLGHWSLLCDVRIEEKNKCNHCHPMESVNPEAE